MPRVGHPVLATLAGVTAIVIIGLATPSLVGPMPLVPLLVAGAALALALWLIGYVTTIRHAGVAWAAGSLVALLGASAALATTATMRAQIPAREDARTLAELEYAADGSAVIERGTDARGPLSRMVAANAKADAEAKRQFEAKVAMLELQRLNSPYLLAQKPDVLDHCDRIGTAEANATELLDARKARIAKLTSAIDALGHPAAIKAAMRDTLDTPAEIDSAQAHNAEMFDATREICTILAQRGWRNVGGYFGFDSQVDQQAIDRAQQRRLRVAQAMGTMQRERKARIEAAQEVLRNWLSSSLLS